MAIVTPLTRASIAGSGYPSDHDVVNDGLDLGNAAQISGNLTFDSAGEPRGLPVTPTASDAAASKAYVDAVAVQSRAWKEVLLAKEQVLNGASGGVLQALLVAFDGNPVATDTFILTDGTTTETFTAVAGAPAAFQFQVGGSAAATLANLVAAINADSTLWSAIDTTGLDAYFASAYANQAVVYRTAVSTAADRVYGTLTTATDIKTVKFDDPLKQDYDISSGVEQNLPAADPASKDFGFGRVLASLATNETHPIAEDITAWTWDTDDQLWRQTDSSAIVGGPGIVRAGSVMSTDLDTGAAQTGSGSNGGSSGLEFDTTGNAGKVRAAVHTTGALGRFASGLGIRLPAANPGLAIVANELDAKLDGLRGLAKDAVGQYIKVDGTTITFDGGGQLQASGAQDAAKIENAFAVNLAIAIGDVVEFDNVNDRVEPGDADFDAESNVVGVAVSAQAVVGQTAQIVSHGVAPAVLAGATVGTPYFLQIGGGLGTAIPAGNNRVVRIGYAKNATDLWVDIMDFGKKF